MAIYRLKRKLYSGTLNGIGEAVKNTVGGVTETAGDVMSSGVGKLGGALGGIALAPKALAAMNGARLAGAASAAGAGAGAAGGAGVVGKFLGASLGLGPIGVVGGALAGAALAKGIGKGLKKMGQNMQT